MKVSNYIIFHHIHPQTNRWREYRIYVHTLNTLSLSWGRILHKKQYKKVVFPNEDVLVQYLYGVLNKRLKHGYQIADISHNFPEYDYPDLDKFTYTPTYAKQLSLFS